MHSNHPEEFVISFILWLVIIYFTLLHDHINKERIWHYMHNYWLVRHNAENNKCDNKKQNLKYIYTRRPDKLITLCWNTHFLCEAELMYFFWKLTDNVRNNCFLQEFKFVIMDNSTLFKNATPVTLKPKIPCQSLLCPSHKALSCHILINLHIQEEISKLPGQGRVWDSCSCWVSKKWDFPTWQCGCTKIFSINPSGS